MKRLLAIIVPTIFSSVQAVEFERKITHEQRSEHWHMGINNSKTIAKNVGLATFSVVAAKTNSNGNLMMVTRTLTVTCDLPNKTIWDKINLHGTILVVEKPNGDEVMRKKSVLSKPEEYKSYNGKDDEVIIYAREICSSYKFPQHP